MRHESKKAVALILLGLAGFLQESFKQCESNMIELS